MNNQKDDSKQRTDKIKADMAIELEVKYMEEKRPLIEYRNKNQTLLKHKLKKQGASKSRVKFLLQEKGQ